MAEFAKPICHWFSRISWEGHGTLGGILFAFGLIIAACLGGAESESLSANVGAGILGLSVMGIGVALCSRDDAAEDEDGED